MVKQSKPPATKRDGAQETASGASDRALVRKDPSGTALNNDIVVGAKPRVGCSMGFTLNMGNYQSARADAWASRDLKPGENVADALASCQAEVEDHLDQQREALAGDR